MGAVFHKFDPTQSITCSSCKAHAECEAHLYQCPARRTVIEVDLTAFLQANYTCPALASILLDSLHREIQGKPHTFQKRHGVQDPKYNALLQAQTNIGPNSSTADSLQIGVVCKTHFWIKTFKLDRRHWSGAIWTRKLISLLWTAMRAQWDLRNADRHGRTTAANHAIRHAHLLTSIHALHTDAPNMLATYRAVLAEPTTLKLQRHPGPLELWLKQTQAIVTRSKADATAAIHRTHERLTSYFRYRRLKKPDTKPTTTNEKDSEKPGPV
jgi:hypothetical protein